MEAEYIKGDKKRERECFGEEDAERGVIAWDRERGQNTRNYESKMSPKKIAYDTATGGEEADKRKSLGAMISVEWVKKSGDNINNIISS